MAVPEGARLDSGLSYGHFHAPMRFPILCVFLGALAACAAPQSAGNLPATGTPPDGGSSSSSSGAPSNGNDAGLPADGGAADADPTPPAADAGPALTTVRVHYPAGTHAVALRGSGGSLSWDKGVAATAGADDTWLLTLPALSAPIELKPLLDDATWSRGPNYKLAPGQVLDVYPHFTVKQGTYAVHWAQFTSKILPSTRGIWLYLPPTYLENTRARLPVLYMHDGQNLFDASAAFGGNEWKVDETMDAAAEDGSAREAIVVGIENTADRMNEYTMPPSGKGDLYVKMITDEIKPMVDAELRTLTTRDQTALCGSSLGGLISTYAGVYHSDVFGLVGAMSPSTWWNGTQILGDVAKVPQQAQRPLKVYVDSGDSGPSNDDVTNTAKLAQAYKTDGYAEGTTLHYVVQPGGQHSEVYWAERLPGGLAFLLGPGR